MTSPELILATLIQRRCSAALGELEAIASCELEAQLEAIRSGRALTPDEQEQLASYLREELGANGMLSRQHMREAGCDAATANRINRQATVLLSLVQ